MTNRIRRFAVLAAFAGGIALGSCKYKEGEAFNERAAELICRAVDSCDKDIRTGEDLVQAHAGCKLELMNALDECDASCDYNAAAAGRCIVELETSSECRRDPSSTKACTKVYTDCDEDFFERDMCRLDVPSCAVGSRPGPWALWAIGLWGLARRRRRRPHRVAAQARYPDRR